MLERFDLTHVHHVNLLVRDLESAKRAYRAKFNIDFIDESLPSRGVLTSRFRIGESWLVLVQPNAEGEPMRQLRERGEDCFCCHWASLRLRMQYPRFSMMTVIPTLHYRKCETGSRVGGLQTSKLRVNLDSCNLLSPKLTKLCSPNFNLQASQSSTNNVDIQV